MKNLFIFVVLLFVCFNSLADSCTGTSPCIAGCYADTYSDCNDCLISEWSDANATTCNACTYPFATTGSNVADHATLHSCKLTCSSGNYYFGSGSGATHNCATCPIGNYCPSNITFYEDDDYNTTFGANPCALNTYQNQTGQSSCNSCPNSGLTAATGTNSINLCYKTGLTYAASHGGGTQKCFYGISAYDHNCTDINITSCVAGYWFQGPANDCTDVTSGYFSANGYVTRTACTSVAAGSTGSSSPFENPQDCYKECTISIGGTTHIASVITNGANSTANQYKIQYPGSGSYQLCSFTIKCDNG